MNQMKTLIGVLACAMVLQGQKVPSFSAKVEEVMGRPEYRHSRFGIEVYSLEDKRALYRLNADQLFIPGSTTKLLTMGTANAVLGPEFRFHTKVYRSGGDLVLVASGDPNLSNRIQADGSMAFANVDHSYSSTPGAKPVPGDPLTVIRDLARQVAAKGITRVEGRVAVDASLFPEGERELGTGVVISPIVVNDNVVDLTMTPGAKQGDAAALTISPITSYVKFVEHIKTGAPGSPFFLRVASDERSPDGRHTVTLEGNVAAGGGAMFRTYRVPEPSVFAAVAFSEALERAGVQVSGKPGKTDKRSYAAANLVAEHISPKLIEATRVVLKVSQNLHASMMPFVVGALAGHATEDVAQAGFDLERNFLESAGLDLSAASQSDGAGGAALYTPDFMVHFLEYMSKQSYFPGFFHALPILGVDGTLWEIQVHNSAAGHVMAKTGTFGAANLMGRNMVVTGKGLAGFVKTKSGKTLAIAVYANFVPGDPATAAHMVGDALGEIAGAAYDALFESLGLH
jgi:D-alanyl-D-alanine carboxypeptidase/D-alanyl-D-alanine-endopeptidase (penicillin-binding protein 4)